MTIGRLTDIIILGDIMTLQDLIYLNKYTIYKFSKESSIPKTTLIDLCNGKTSIENSKAITIKKIANTLGLSMEYIMNLDSPKKKYLEFNIPPFLEDSITKYVNNLNTSCVDIYYGILQSDINVAEVGSFISPNQAWYLRKKYLGVDIND